MFFSTLKEIRTQRDMVEDFRGYNHNLKISANEFFDMKNLTSANYPVLSPRPNRGTYEYPVSSTPVSHRPSGLIAKDALCYVDNGKLYINNKEISGLNLTSTPKQMVSMGAYIIIMPDKKYINTMDYSDKGDIEANYTSSGTVSFELCKEDGTVYENTIVSPTEPANPVNMTLWIDTSSTPHTLKQYSTSSSMWVQIATTYVKIKASGIGSSFKAFDAVKISGIDPSLTQLKDLNDQISPLWEVHHDANSPANDYIVVVGIIDTVSTQTSPLTVSRSMPNLDFIIESENRLWGCRYGQAADGQVVNEIYASKLGDFKNWNCFMGLSTDSYTASCGTDGQWTGAITHLGYPLFFKENCLHKVFGHMPSNYQIQTTTCRGVQKGAGNSLAIVNEILYYKSRNGVCAYDGSLPSDISAAFGDIHYTGIDENNADFLRNGATAGALGNKYYISMKSEADNQYYLFVYDTSKGMWHKEDNTRADLFCACRNELYYIDHDESTIKSVMGSGNLDTKPFEWMAETGIITYPYVQYGQGMDIDKKYVSRIDFRMSLGIGSKVMLYAQYDSSGEWEHLNTITGTSLRTFAIPVKPKRCDHLRLRIVGIGEAKIYAITKTFEQGSDM